MKDFSIRNQNGQTIVETVVAIFVMVMGITAALGLANYAFTSSTNITKQIIGMGLAREGIESVKNMRDTNWLKAGSPQTNCYNFSTGSLDATCYTTWLNPGSAGSYNINTLDYVSNGNNSYVLTFSPLADLTPGLNNRYWQPTVMSGLARYALDFDPNATVGASSAGFYKPAASNPGTSGFYRKISIRFEGANNLSAVGPFASYTAQDPYREASVGPRIRVIAEVWWKDKGCADPASNGYDAPTKGSCRIKLEQYLTNWKNY